MQRRLRGRQGKVDVHLVGQAVQDPGVGQGAGAAQGLLERPVPTLPGQVGAGLVHRRRHGEHDVGPFGHC